MKKCIWLLLVLVQPVLLPAQVDSCREPTGVTAEHTPELRQKVQILQCADFVYLTALQTWSRQMNPQDRNRHLQALRFEDMINEVDSVASSFEGPYWNELATNLNQLKVLHELPITPDTSTIKPEDLTLITRLQNNNLPALIDSIQVLLENQGDTSSLQSRLDSLRTILQDVSRPFDAGSEPANGDPEDPQSGDPQSPSDPGFNPPAPQLANRTDISAVAVRELADYLRSALTQLITLLQAQRNQESNASNREIQDTVINLYNNDLSRRLNAILVQTNEAARAENRADAARTRLTVLDDEYNLIKQNLIRQDQDLTTFYFNTEWNTFMDLQKNWLTENTNSVVNATFLDRFKWAATGAFFISAGILLHKALSDDTPGGGVDIDVQLPN